MSFGARAEDWQCFSRDLGLTTDVLPVVSNPNGVVSAASKLKAIGKVPSLYNHAREVVGIAQWTQSRSTLANIEAWSREPNYGLCIQTRRVRALDIDIVGGLADEVEAVFARVAGLGDSLPCRFRSNSSKRLLAFVCEGEIPKRRMVVEGGIVELLADGQQFVACGTHPSGARYEWRGGLPRDIPTLSLQTLDDAWQLIAAKFATETPHEGRVSRAKGVDLDVDDPVAAWLSDTWPTFGSKGGKLYVECPWAGDHTSDSGDTQSAWLMAGTKGYARGHYLCMHAHCAHRTDADFMRAVGYMASGFDIIEAAPKVVGAVGERAGGDALPEPVFVRDRLGMIEATINNAYAAVSRPNICGYNMGYDKFSDSIMLSARDDPQGWREVADVDYVALRMALEGGLGLRRVFKPIGRELMRDAVLAVADNSSFDSAVTWLAGLTWDGTPRIDTFMSVYCQSRDEAYSRAVSAYMWTAMAGRVVSPGSQVDMTPVWIGAQGARKTSSARALVPDHRFFVEIDLTKPDDDLARLMSGRLIGEIGELKGLSTRDEESIKAFMTRREDKWVPKYRECATAYPRRIFFIATTNQSEFLSDDTGNRRWLPINVGECGPDMIARDRDQLWAEAVSRYLIGGIEYHEAERLGSEKHAEHMLSDPWFELIAEWLDKPEAMMEGVVPSVCPFLRVADIARWCLRVETSRLGRGEERRIGKILRAMGWDRKKFRVKNASTNAFYKNVPNVPNAKSY